MLFRGVINQVDPTESMEQSVPQIFIQSICAEVSLQLGGARIRGDLDYFSHKFLHAVNGAFGGITGGVEGMVSGAAGATGAEVFAEAFIDAKTVAENIARKNPGATIDDVVQKTREATRFREDISKLVGATTGGLVGGNASVAFNTASSAIDNNFTGVEEVLIVDSLLMLGAFTAAQIATYLHGKNMSPAAVSYLQSMQGRINNIQQRAEIAAVAGGTALLDRVGRFFQTGHASQQDVGSNSEEKAVETAPVEQEPGKARNKPPAPLPEAEGRPHTIVEKPGKDGQYTTHNGDGTWKQYRGAGKAHGPVPRPNIKEAGKNVLPDGRTLVDKGRVRLPRPDETPGGRQ